MTLLREENFLSTPPCPFRRVSFGRASCTISTDGHYSDVDPLTCHNCGVPPIISQPRCRYLSLGTELKSYRGEGRVVTSMACKALNIKLYSLKTCEECSLYSEVESLTDVIHTNERQAEVQIPIRHSLVEEIARDIKLDYGLRESEEPPLRPVHCWRFPEGHCRKFPIYTQGKVTVHLVVNSRNEEIYKQAVIPAIRAMNLQAYRIEDELVDSEQMCRVCENAQESDFLVLSLDDWTVNSVFLAGIAYGLGIRIALLKNESLQPVPLMEHMQHDVIHYVQPESLKEKLIEHFTPYVKPTLRD